MSAALPRLLAALLAVLLLPVGAGPAVAASAIEGPASRVLLELDSPMQPAALGAARGNVLTRVRDMGARPLRTYAGLPYVAVEATGGELARLRRGGGIRAVLPDEQLRPTLAVTVPLVGADLAWTAGATGSGQAVAVLDTGVDSAHPFLAGKVIAEACFAQSSTCPNGRTSQIGPGSGAPCTYDEAACGHGTHVAGIVAGAGTSRNGVAKGASLIAVQVFSRTSTGCSGGAPTCAVGWTSDLLAGLDHVASLAATTTIAAVNLSLGGGSFTGTCDNDQPALKAAVDRLRTLGVPTVASSGNAGSTGAMSAPACLSSAVAVGSTSSSDVVSRFSNSSPELDLLAPGEEVVSSFPQSRLAWMTGTSQAAPHVAGALAVLRQAKPAATVTQLVTALTSTGPAVTDARNGRTTRRLRVDLALTALRNALAPAPAATSTPAPAPAPAPNAVTDPSPDPTLEPVLDPAPVGSTRLSGADRYDTAAGVFTAAFGCPVTGGVDRAVLARGDAFADALAGSYLAGTHDTGVLLTATTSVPPATLAALRASAARTVYLLGGSAAISDAVAAQLAVTPSYSCDGVAGSPLAVVRISGANRYDTARRTAEAAGVAAVGMLAPQGSSPDGPALRTAIVASGVGFADALAAGPLSYAGSGDGRGFPTLLTGAAVLAPEAERALVSLGVQQVLVPGGTAAVGPEVEARLRALGLLVVRLAGGNRTETAAAVARFAVDRLGFASSGVALARGDSFADALAGAAYAGAKAMPLLLTASPTLLSDATRSYLATSVGIGWVTVLGGDGAIAAGTLAEALAAASTR